MLQPGPPPLQTPQSPIAPPKRKPPLLFVLLGFLGLCIVGLGVLGSMASPLIAQIRRDMVTSSCVENVRIQSLALIQYTEVNDGVYPRARHWMSVAHRNMAEGKYLVHPIHGEDYGIKALDEYGIHHPDDIEVDGAFHYAMNTKLSMKRLWELEEQQIVTYESTNPAWSACDPLESYPNDGFHEFQGIKKVVVSTTSGSAMVMPPQEIERRKKTAK